MVMASTVPVHSPVRIVGKNVSQTPVNKEIQSKRNFTSPLKNFLRKKTRNSNSGDENNGSESKQKRKLLPAFKFRKGGDGGEVGGKKDGLGTKVKNFVRKTGRRVTDSSDSSCTSSNKQTPKKKKRTLKVNNTTKSLSEPTLSNRDTGSSSMLSLASTSSGKTTKKKKKKNWSKKRKSNSVLPQNDHTRGASSSHCSRTDQVRELVFPLDVKTQNMRLITARQRQEIYALNRVMTRLENEKFKKFCAGHKGEVEDCDIFL